VDTLPLLLLPLASCQLVETVHHGSIFGWLRDAARRSEDNAASMSWVTLGLSWPLRAVNCAFCLSHWAVAVGIGLMFCGPVGLWLLVWLAGIRTANLINDCLRPFCRTPLTRSPEEVLKEVSTEHLEEEFIRRTAHPFGVSIGAVPAPGPTKPRPAS